MGTNTQHRTRTFRTGLAAAAAGIVLAVTGVAVSPAAGGEGRGLEALNDHQIAVCHATESADNPYSVVYPNKYQLFSPNGHGWDEDDIIPPFEAGSQGANSWDAFDGLNWDEDGQDLWAAGCAVTTDDDVVLPPAPAGSVTVDKELAGSPLPADTTEFAFSVSCSAGLVPEAAPMVAPVDEALEVASGLDVGDTCTIDETDAKGAAATGFSVDGADPVTGPVEVTITEAGQGVAIVVTNTFACPDGQVEDGQGGCGVDACPEAGFQADASECPVDVCPEPGVQAPGTTCEEVSSDLCEDVPGDQTSLPCPEDACPEVPGFQATDAACQTELIPPVVIENLPPQAQAPEVVPSAPRRPVQVAGIQVRPSTTAAAQELPRTGVDTGTLVQLGLGLVLAGAGAMVAARRPQEAVAG